MSRTPTPGAHQDEAAADWTAADTGPLARVLRGTGADRRDRRFWAPYVGRQRKHSPKTTALLSELEQAVTITGSSLASLLRSAVAAGAVYLRQLFPQHEFLEHNVILE